MLSLKSYRLLAYFGLIPFLVFTYQSWCGPIEDVHASTTAFLLFSSATLIFISGCWWGFCFSQAKEPKLLMMLIGLVFGLGSALTTIFLSPEWSVATLGLAHFVIWVLEFFIPGFILSHSYKIQRTILTMAIVVCHVLVSTQFF